MKIKNLFENDGTKAEIIFMNYARSKGYKDKVVGDYAYTKNRQKWPHSPTIKLLGAKNNKLQIYEDGKGRYEIEMNYGPFSK
jgi:hypothetical protein